MIHIIIDLNTFCTSFTSEHPLFERHQIHDVWNSDRKNAFDESGVAPVIVTPTLPKKKQKRYVKTAVFFFKVPPKTHMSLPLLCIAICSYQLSSNMPSKSVQSIQAKAPFPAYQQIRILPDKSKHDLYNITLQTSIFSDKQSNSTIQTQHFYNNDPLFLTAPFVYVFYTDTDTNIAY